MNHHNAAHPTRQPLGFHEIHRKLPNADPQVRQAVADAMGEDLWLDLRRRVEDRRWLAGDDTFRSGRRKARLTVAPQPKAMPSIRKDDDLDGLLTSIRSLSFAEYGPAIAGVEALPGGRCRCPLPEHEDLNPSASWKDNLFHCHRCGEGGDLILLASRISGIDTRGSDFIELVKWIGERLVLRAEQITQESELRAA